jgi:hypothetical protein
MHEVASGSDAGSKLQKPRPLPVLMRLHNDTATPSGNPSRWQSRRPEQMGSKAAGRRQTSCPAGLHRLRNEGQLTADVSAGQKTAARIAREVSGA